MKLLTTIMTSTGLWYLYLTAIEKTIVYFKESIDQGRFTWCCLSIGMLSAIYFAFCYALLDELEK